MIELELDYDDDDLDSADETEEPKVTLASSMETRRKIEDMLERKRLREEFGNIDW